ncbi:7327_t:CDS:2, partial [Entrophospora sp. SA101]
MVFKIDYNLFNKSLLIRYFTVILSIILLNGSLLVNCDPAAKRCLYVYGGRFLTADNLDNLDEFSPGIDTNDILYLDVSVNFDPKNPVWNPLTADSPVAFH